MSIQLGRTVQLTLTNRSGASVAQGAVVVMDTASAEAFTTTTTERLADGVVGVVVEPDGIPANGKGAVAVDGPVPRVNLDSSAALGDYLYTDAVAGQGTPGKVWDRGAFGRALEGGTATPKALLFGLSRVPRWLLNRFAEDYPAVANSLDDEFDDDSIDPKWSWINQGTASISESSAEHGYTKVTAPSSTDPNLRMRAQAAPAGNFTIEAKVMFSGLEAVGAAGRTPEFGVFVTVASPGIVWYVGCWREGTATPRLFARRIRRTSPTTGGDNVVDYATAIGNPNRPVYLRLEINGANLLGYVSTDGLHWYNHAPAVAHGIAIAQVGFLVNGGAEGRDVNVLFDYFRRVA